MMELGRVGKRNLEHYLHRVHHITKAKGRINNYSKMDQILFRDDKGESGMLTWTIGNQTNPTLLCWLMSLKGSQLDASGLLPASKPYISFISYTQVWLTFTRSFTIWIQAGAQMSVYKGGIQVNYTSKYSEKPLPRTNLESKWDKHKSHSFNTPLQQIIINSG